MNELLEKIAKLEAELLRVKEGWMKTKHELERVRNLAEDRYDLIVHLRRQL